MKLGAQPATASDAEQVGVEHQSGLVLAGGQRAQATDEQEVLLQRRLALVSVSRSAVSSIAVPAVYRA